MPSVLVFASVLAFKDDRFHIASRFIPTQAKRRLEWATRLWWRGEIPNRKTCSSSSSLAAGKSFAPNDQTGDACSLDFYSLPQLRTPYFFARKGWGMKNGSCLSQLSQTAHQTCVATIDGGPVFPSITVTFNTASMFRFAKSFPSRSRSCCI